MRISSNKIIFCASNSLSYPWKIRPKSLFNWNFGNSKAEPFYHDDVDLQFPSSLLSKTFLKGRELKCCYKASLDGFSATEFHKCCDFKGPCVIIGYTNKSFKFGAFNPEGYRSTDDYYYTFDAYLFYWALENDQNEPTFDAFLFYWALENDQNEPYVLPKIGGSGAALFDYARGGPQFGADGLLIGPPLAPVMGGFAGPDTNSGIGVLSEAKSRLGLSYAKREDGKKSLFGDESRAVVDEAHFQALQAQKAAPCASYIRHLKVFLEPCVGHVGITGFFRAQCACHGRDAGTRRQQRVQAVTRTQAHFQPLQARRQHRMQAISGILKFFSGTFRNLVQAMSGIMRFFHAWCTSHGRDAGTRAGMQAHEGNTVCKPYQAS
ncbi:unnamed protein product [Fraxinus pennsylvanica]|uniref:TLDc domain-containing protein n=1 Tax=Fraxinus pennsylvanica TaxID=56036 RepID=A0AAD2A7A2_9LAMI|nr:unnamed protein product [Fraxinus pennsylvanica]